jgi:hypothetical protein
MLLLDNEPGRASFVDQGILVDLLEIPAPSPSGTANTPPMAGCGISFGLFSSACIGDIAFLIGVRPFLCDGAAKRSPKG